MANEVKVATITATESMNEADNASSVELIDIVKELTIEEGNNMEIDDAIDNLGFNL